MSKWIDARWMTSVVDRMVGHNSIRPRDIYDAINDAPSIDIVRCRECKKAHLTANGACKYCEEWKDDDGNYIEVYHDGEHFCSYGERRE